MSDHEEENIDVIFGKAVLKGALIGLPIMLVFITVSVRLITDEPLHISVVSSILAGVLLGVFGGGFIGALSVMKRMH